MKGGVKDLVASIAAKYGVEPARILQTTHIDKNGLCRKIDDEVVRNFPKGQEMVLEFSNISAQSTQWEWDQFVDTGSDSEELDVQRAVIGSEGYELRLIF
jgi:hypothetical protein